MAYLNSWPYSASCCMDMCASGTQPNLLSQLQTSSLQFRGHCLETKQGSVTCLMAFHTISRKLGFQPQHVSLTFVLTRGHVGPLQLIQALIVSKQPTIIFIVAPCILKIYWVLHTNKCTNCVSYIKSKITHIKTLSLLLHVSIEHCISSSGSTYISWLNSLIKIMNTSLWWVMWQHHVFVFALFLVHVNK
jgi:hypothetical protein